MNGRNQEDAASRLGWAIRRYAAVILAAMVATTAALVAVLPEPPEETYEASALIVAQRLESIRPEHLPRMVQAIYEGNNVGPAAVELADLDIDPERLRTDHTRLEVFEGTVVSRVNGSAGDPESAAAYADAMAEALVRELNRMGPEVGQFALQERAAVPEEPEPQTLAPSPLLLGPIAGALLGLGLLVLFLMVRRPVLESGAASAQADLPLAGVLELAQAGHFDRPREVRGSAWLAERLFPQGSEMVSFVAAQSANPRSQVAVLLARTVAAVRPVVFVAASDGAGHRAARLFRPWKRISTVRDVVEAPDASGPIIVDGGAALAGTQGHALPHTYLVAAEGISTRRLRRAAQRCAPGELAGIVWVMPRIGLVQSVIRRLTASWSRPQRADAPPVGSTAARAGNRPADATGGDRDRELSVPRGDA